MQLKLTHAHLPARPGSWDLLINDGRILAIEPQISDPADQVLDGTGCLVIPGLVDPHMHLDKAYLLDRTPAMEGTFAEAMRETLCAKQAFTVADIQSRARQSIEASIRFGTTAMRSHVEVDPGVKLTGMEALLPLRQEYSWGLTLQLAVFAQEGITNQPGSLELLRQAMKMGGDVIGSAPYIDPDPAENIRLVFDLAQEFDCDVDFHLDFLDDEADLDLPFVIDETERRGWQGRVCLGHMTKLAGVSPDHLKSLAPRIRAAGISILALPASDVYIMARKDTHNVRRGVAPVHHLAKWGVNTGLAVNNVQNLFTPFGDGDVLKICTLLAQILQLGTESDHHLCLEMATTQAAKAIGIRDHGLAAGNQADLVMIKAISVSQVIGSAPVERTVIKQGQVVAQTRLDYRFPLRSE